MKKLVLIITVFSIVSVTSAQPWTQIQKVVNSDRESGDAFGNRVAISGSYAIMGTLREDDDLLGLNNISLAGSAYIFEKNGAGTWFQKQKIIAPNRLGFDQFGSSVSISGDYAIVGAQFEDEDSAESNTLTNPGSAYIFERNGAGTWVFKQKIVASDRSSNANFGRSIGISGNFAVVTTTGSAYVFERNGVGVWVEKQKLTGSNLPINFGFSVSISGDYIAVGDYFNTSDNVGMPPLISSAGAAYIFERNGAGLWVEKQKIVTSDRATSGDGRFGSSISISGNYVIIGAPLNDWDNSATPSNFISNSGSAYIFERNGAGVWLQKHKITAPTRGGSDEFGNSVSISGDYAVIGAHQESEDVNEINNILRSGSAYVFERNGAGIWNFQQKLVASDRGKTFDKFAESVAISGSYIFSGAESEDEDATGANTLSGPGAVYIFENPLIVLPIELISFNGNKNGAVNDLYWTTATEINNDFFTLERSNDAIRFTEIKKINGAGNSNSLLNYRETDFSPTSGINYYRLKQTDFNGDFSYSKIVALENSEGEILSIYPNPSSNFITINYLANSLKNYSIKVYDTQGKIVINQNINEDNTNYKLNINQLNEGLYFIRINNENSIYKGSFFKNK